MPQRTYKAVFFDLDGTLLPIDMDAFLNRYFTDLPLFAADHGYDGQQFMKAVGAGVQAMMQSEGGRNDDRYWETFCSMVGGQRSDHEPVMEQYYRTAFDALGEMVQPHPAAAQIVALLREKGYRLYLTTMPLFPRVAVEKRLGWAQVPVDVFERITTYDNSTSTKPRLAYYQENLDVLGLDAHDVLMVGNNTREDMSALKLGLDGYLVTDWLLDPEGFDIDSVKHGSLNDFLQFVQDLPQCAADEPKSAADEPQGAADESENTADISDNTQSPNQQDCGAKAPENTADQSECEA